MRHVGFEDLHLHVALFQRLAQELEELRCHLTTCGHSHASGWYVMSGRVEIGEDDSYESATLTLRFVVASGECLAPRLEMSLGFCGAKTACSAFRLQHQAKTWMITSDRVYSTQSRMIELLERLRVRAGESIVINEERALNAVREMADYYLQLGTLLSLSVNVPVRSGFLA